MPAGITPSVIVKFTRFRGKDEVYKNRRMLKRMFNPINNRKIWMKETLPPPDAFVEKLARSKKLIAVTNICKVLVMCKNNKGENVFVRVNNALDVNNLKNPVIRDVPNFSGANAVKLKANHVVAQKDSLINRKGNLRQCPLRKKDNTVLSLMVFNILLLTIQGSDN